MSREKSRSGIRQSLKHFVDDVIDGTNKIQVVARYAEAFDLRLNTDGDDRWLALLGERSRTKLSGYMETDDELPVIYLNGNNIIKLNVGAIFIDCSVYQLEHAIAAKIPIHKHKLR